MTTDNYAMGSFDRGYAAFKRGEQLDDDANSFWQDGWKQAMADEDWEAYHPERADDPWMDDDYVDPEAVEAWHDYVDGE